MPQSEWGSKHTCQECNAKYYDMGRDPILCPLCGVLLVEKPVLARVVQSLSKELRSKEENKEELKKKKKEAEASTDDEDILADDDVLPELEEEDDDVDSDEVPSVDDGSDDEELTNVIDETKVTTNTE